MYKLESQLESLNFSCLVWPKYPHVPETYLLGLYAFLSPLSKLS